MKNVHLFLYLLNSKTNYSKITSLLTLTTSITILSLINLLDLINYTIYLASNVVIDQF